MEATLRPIEAAGEAAPRGRERGERLVILDGARFFAALAVVFFHYAYYGPAHGWQSLGVSFPTLASVCQYGYLGVDLFFLISGFVILMSAEGKTPTQFAWSRFCRLYPAFWTCCTVTYLLSFLLFCPFCRCGRRGTWALSSMPGT